MAGWVKGKRNPRKILIILILGLTSPYYSIIDEGLILMTRNKENSLCK
jgi:hypothetical protein